MKIYQLKISPVKASRYSFLNNSHRTHFAVRPVMEEPHRVVDHKSFLEMSVEEMSKFFNKKKR